MALQHYEQGKFDILVDKVFHHGEEANFFNLTYNFNNRLGKVIFSYE